MSRETAIRALAAEFCITDIQAELTRIEAEQAE
jgi:hypothetical protein